MSKIIVAPSILSADFSDLASEIKSVEEAGAEWIHIDVMDGHFVPNLTIGAPVVKSLRSRTSLFLDAHLMVTHPAHYVDSFCKAGANSLTIHVESEGNIEDILNQIKSADMKAGISVKPKTGVDALKPYLSLVDLVLVMTVEPGFSGQSFMSEPAKKIKELVELRKENNWSYLIQVDGGVSESTVQQCQGCDVFVAGSYIFKNNYKDSITKLKELGA